jgi:hypothetical protein
MNNLILNLDAQLWIFDSTPDSQKFAIENISSKKVGKILTLFPFFFLFFHSRESRSGSFYGL